MHTHSGMILLLEKFLSDKNKLTKEELSALRVFFSSVTGKEVVEQWLIERWQRPVSNYLDINFHSLYRQIEQKMEQASAAKKTIRILPIVMRAAAILSIPLLLGFILLLNRQNQVVILSEQLPVSIMEYSCPAGMRSKVLLPDSTQVWLNADSRLVLRQDFGYGTRSVSLSGEAFFEVSHKENLPFIVSTPEVDIKVLGTSFNLSAYPEDEVVEAVLVNGHIEVTNKQASGRSKEKFGMQPAQHLSLQKNKQELKMKDNVNTELYTAWVNNKLVFEDTPMREVMTRLERWYNVNILLKDERLNKYTFTGSFDNRTLSQILTYIAQSSPILYAIKDDTITISMR